MQEIRIVVAVILAGVAWFIARLEGKFLIYLDGFQSPIECSPLYLNPVSRFLYYKLAPWVLIVVAALIMPHWIGWIIAPLIIWHGWRRGARAAQVEYTIQMAQYFMQVEELDHSAAWAKAQELRNTILNSSAESMRHEARRTLKIR